ncbi:hypothetical protein B0A55_05867 [Friedmanniomyces simplex]|uniref:Carboxymuconolactone decarboxylase-like domain-containing protein n=1 Tax=Friedmanniomyces simplex TaxID=329884 RepID=A0A4U0XB20_9PEZI|nr:hypothetical protein B0A55_05867 [Friedmanniomyces simplex]
MSKAKETFTNALGEAAWDQSWDTLSKLDPEIFEASVKLMAVPKQKKHLSTKMQSLVRLSVDCAATHLYIPGIRLHVKNAAAAGATLAEVMEVLELSSTLGIHACNIGVPLLVQVMKEEGLYDSHATAGKPSDSRRLALKDDFAAKRGYWHSFWDDFLALDPEFFEAYTEFSSVPWTKRVEGVDGHVGALSNRDKELIYCAFDCAATHLYVSGLKEHMRNALRYGATVEQVVEVLELATALSLHTLNVTAPIAQEIYGQR